MRESKTKDPIHPNPNWQHWLVCDSWNLDQATALSLDIDPCRITSDYRGVFLPIPVPIMMLLPLDFFRRLVWTKEACADGSLRAVMQSAEGGMRVRPGDFARWALANGWPVPQELRTLVAVSTAGADLTDDDFLLASQIGRRRGRPPEKTDAIEKAMRAAYKDRLGELRLVGQEALAKEFNVSRTTVRAARKRIISGP